MIITILALAVIEIALFIVSVMLRSRSVATLNFIICLTAGCFIWPWANFGAHPPRDEELRLNWIAGMASATLFGASILVLGVCLIITRQSSPPPRSKRSKRRKHRKSGKTRAELLGNSAAVQGEEDAEAEPDRDNPDPQSGSF